MGELLDMTVRDVIDHAQEAGDEAVASALMAVLDAWHYTRDSEARAPHARVYRAVYDTVDNA